MQIPLPDGNILIKHPQRTHSEYLQRASRSIAFSSYEHLIDWRSGGIEIDALPVPSNVSKPLSFSLCKPLQSLHQCGEPEQSWSDNADQSAAESLHSFPNEILPAASSFARAGNAQAVHAFINLHNLSSSESGLHVVCNYLGAIKQRIANFRAHNKTFLPTDAPELLGFRSLTIVCGRGAGSSAQGYSTMRLVLFEYLVRLGIVSIARANTPPLVGAENTVACASASVSIDTVDLWEWCVSNADRPISLVWQRSPPPL
jgi:hypothetical protein